MTTEPAVEQPAESTVMPVPVHGEDRFNYRQHWELILLFTIGVIGAVAALTGAPIPLRIIFGIPLVVFIPGYALACTLFPSNDGLDGLERLALGFGLSLALVPLIALSIEFSRWRLTLTPTVVALVACSLIFSLTAGWRRQRSAIDRRFVASFPKPSIAPIATWQATSKIAGGVLIGGLLVFGISSSALVAERLRPDPSTEFALFNATGQATYYPRDFAPGVPQTIQLQIENDEGRDVNYRLVVLAEDQIIGSLDSIQVASGERWQEPVNIELPATMIPADANQPVPLKFNLYRAGDSSTDQPYRTLRLFINISTGESSTP